mgnify:CR=1 FL=1
MTKTTTENVAKKSIYQKLAEARVELQNQNIKKTGENRYSNFMYYELSDLLPPINKICAEYGILTTFKIETKDNTEEAVLTVFNSHSDKNIEFRSPTAEAFIGKKRDGTGGADPIQNLGGKITYMRRYMLMIAFEIVETDIVDSKKQMVPKKPTQAPNAKPASESQRKMYFAIAKSAGYVGEVAKKIAKKAFNLDSFTDISFEQCNKMINTMQNRIKKNEEDMDKLLDELPDTTFDEEIDGMEE